MPFELPPHTRLRGAKLYLNLPIPRHLAGHFKTSGGKPRSHIVEALGTSDPVEAKRLARLRVGAWEETFRQLESGRLTKVPPRHQGSGAYRVAIAEARQEGNEPGVEALEDMAQAEAEALEVRSGPAVAQLFYRHATTPDRLSLLEALAKLDDEAEATPGTRAKRGQHVRELLAFLKVDDCMPEGVNDAAAVAFVEHLNQGQLSKSTKQDKLSSLQTLWRFLERRRQVPKGSSPWLNHHVTEGRRVKGTAPPRKRAWAEDELVTIFTAPEPTGRPRTYTRALFRELYALGLLTGMRLDEIVSLEPADVALDTAGGVAWLTIREAKTEAGVRCIPVVHPVALRLMQGRAEKAAGKVGRLFAECLPGGPDDRPSWQVQKALGRDRDALGFGPEVDFHSTRRSFLTMMENSGADVVHVQRYVGHRVPTMMHSVYSEGASRESLLRVARSVRYTPQVEAALAPLGQGAAPAGRG